VSIIVIKVRMVPVPVAARPKVKFCGRSPAEILGSNPTGPWMFVCNELVTRPVESYRLLSVVVCDL